MKQKRFVLRDEKFGYTLFDRVRMRHKFLSKIDADFKFQDITVDDFERLTADLSEAPADIIYSPIKVYFELTSACLLRCKTCFNQSGKAKHDEMTTDEVKKTLRGLRSDNVFDIRFSGGEVTARPDW